MVMTPGIRPRLPRAELQRVLAEAERILEVDYAVEKGVKDGKTFGEAAAAAKYIRTKIDAHFILGTTGTAMAVLMESLTQVLDPHGHHEPR